MSFPIQRQSRIFVSSEEALNASARLERLISFENALSGVVNAQRCIEKVISIWQSFIQKQLDAIQMKEGLIQTFTACSTGSPLRRTLPCSLSEMMSSDISQTTTLDDLQFLYERVMKDCSTLKTLPKPVNKSAVGKQGPTLLVDYSNPEQEVHSLVAYVLKWTNKKELVGYLMCKTLLPQCQVNFRIPENGWFDFENQFYLDGGGRLQKIDFETAQKLSASFHKIPQLLGIATRNIHGDLLLVMERISGENLAEFAAVKYRHLQEEQKFQLFYEFGKLLILDLLLGNADRLIRFKDLSESNFEVRFSPEEGANLGNLMFVKRGGNYFMHLIDNGVEDEFITNPENRRKHVEFLRGLFSQKGIEKTLTSVLLKSLDSGFKYISDDHGISAHEVKEIQRDLKTVARMPMERGMVDMMRKLYKIAPEWDSVRAELLKEQLHSIYPAYLDAFEERLAMFSACMDGLKGSRSKFPGEVSLVYSV